MDHDRVEIEPSHDNFRPIPWRFDRRRFLQLTGLAGFGLAAGGGWTVEDDELLKPTDVASKPDTEHAQALAPSTCGNTPFGGPFYHGKPAVSKENDLGPGQGQKVLIDLDRAWAIGQPLIIKFLNGQNDPWIQQVHQRVRELAPTWCDYANLSMQFVNDGPCHLTVNFQPFVDQFGQHSYGLFNCLLGRDCYTFKSQVQSMNLLFTPAMQQWPADFRDAEFHRLILHEFGHALGMIHEHQRPDRPIVWMQSLYSVARDKWGWDEKTVNQQIVSKQQAGNYAGTVFDEKSIMMYEYPIGVAYYQLEGAPPNTPDLSRPFASQSNTKLTALDKVAAAVTYPRPGAPRIGEDALMVGAAPQAGKLTAAGQVAPFTFKTGAAGDYTIAVAGPLPALVGLMKERNGRDSRGSLANILAAAESADPSGATLPAKGLAANTDYFVEVRHLKPMTQPVSGEFTIQLRQG
ncbi:MAG TPA: M12 family metallopeptidase [Isosphaeraceae bacterium]|nr:M12 family metallopeptidase [Isosphaeraceae bacterium]